MRQTENCKPEEAARIAKMLTPEKNLWDQGKIRLAGIDEVGRGPLAGPVVAAAVIFPQDIFIAGINDSKKVSAKKREELFPVIMEKAIEITTGMVHEREIDRINILQATRKAMRICIGSFKQRPDHLLIDGRGLPEKFYPQTAIEGGDRICFSIAAASIIAKVTRDRMMLEYDEMFPEYGFAKHKGYGTKQHMEAIRRYGRCPIHRESFHVKGLD